MIQSRRVPPEGGATGQLRTISYLVVRMSSPRSYSILESVARHLRFWLAN